METQIFGTDFWAGGIQVGQSRKGLSLVADYPFFLHRQIQTQQLPSLTVIPLGNKQLRLPIPGAIAGPKELSPVRVKDGQTVEPFPEGGTNRLTFPLPIHQVELKVLKSLEVG